MKSFKKHITEGAGHMTHAEDLVLYGGAEGVQSAINSLRQIGSSLSGGNSSTNVTVKWDGAPAVFAGEHPETGEFFVAKKGIFNKDPKVYMNIQDIKADTSGDLQAKMIEAFTHLKKLGIKGIVQGDLMFTKSDLKKEVIDNRNYVTFHPNTIVYAVPLESAESILKAKIGIVFHTQYTGKSFDTLKASYKVNTSSFKNTPDVWWRTADLKNVSKQVSLSKADKAKLDGYLNEAERIFKKIKPTTLASIYNDPDLAQRLEQYNNTFVRKGEALPPSNKHVYGLIKWMTDRFEKDIESKKSDKGKEQAREKMKKAMAFFSEENKKNLVLVYDLQAALVSAKKMIISQLDRISELSTFVKTRDGFKVTGQEGYVAVSTDLGGQSAVKLVDRLEFSKNNFGDGGYILRGWEKEVAEDIEFSDMQTIDSTDGSWDDSSGLIARKYRQRRMSEGHVFVVKYKKNPLSPTVSQTFDTFEEAQGFLKVIKSRGMHGIIEPTSPNKGGK